LRGFHRAQCTVEAVAGGVLRGGLRLGLGQRCLTPCGKAFGAGAFDRVLALWLGHGGKVWRGRRRGAGKARVEREPCEAVGTAPQLRRAWAGRECAARQT
jgi:hypothetical protein